MKNFINFFWVNFGKFYSILLIFVNKINFINMRLKGGVRAYPLYEVNFLLFYFL
jgi:hypothetical protein